MLISVVLCALVFTPLLATAQAGGELREGVDGASSQTSEATEEVEANEGDEPANEIVTMEWVMDRAASMSPLVAIEEGQVVTAAARRFEAIWNRFPLFRAELNVTPAPTIRLEVDEETGEIDPFSNRDSDQELLNSILSDVNFRIGGDLTAIVPITTFGRIRLARNLSVVGIEVAEIQHAASIAEARFSAFRAYRTVQWYREIDRILRDAESALDIASEELEWAIDDGDRTARTSLRQLRIARTAFVTLRGDADAVGLLARHALSQTLEMPVEFRAERLDEAMPEGEPPSLRDVLDSARESRTDYALLDAAVRAADLDHRLRWRQLTPDLFFVARLSGAYTPSVDNVSGAFITDNFNRFGYGFLVGMRWSMNPATVVARARRSGATRDVVAAQRDAAWAGIELEITEAYFSAMSRRNILLSYEDAMRAADAWLNQAQFQYDQGLADFDDLKDPMETFYRTSGGYYESILRYDLALADLALKCGAHEFEVWPGATE